MQRGPAGTWQTIGAGKAPGEFRSPQNWIGGTRPGNALFVPRPPQEVERCMGELERFLDSGDSYGAFVKAALAGRHKAARLGAADEANLAQLRLGDDT